MMLSFVWLEEIHGGVELVLVLVVESDMSMLLVWCISLFEGA